MAEDDHVDAVRPRLKVRRVSLDTGRENVVVVSRHSNALRPDVFRGYSRVELRSGSQASYRALQSKFGNVLGNRAPVVKRVDIPKKGVSYRAFAGPFGSQDEAAQMCNSLKAAGGQCFVQRN